MTLPALIARLEAATGPDRELDAELAVTIAGFWVERRPYNDPAFCYKEGDEIRKPRQAGDMLVPRYTASLDAVIALVEAKLPGTEMRLHTYTDAKTWVELGRRMGTFHETDTVSVRAAAAPLALILALCRALQAQEMKL